MTDEALAAMTNMAADKMSEPQIADVALAYIMALRAKMVRGGATVKTLKRVDRAIVVIEGMKLALVPKE
jgi:hypothetical protein